MLKLDWRFLTQNYQSCGSSQPHQPPQPPNDKNGVGDNNEDADDKDGNDDNDIDNDDGGAQRLLLLCGWLHHRSNSLGR